MLKKCTAILMMFTAYAFLLGHNIIPHHHHDHEQEVTGHHHNHHHDNEEESNELSNPFSQFTHSADGITFNLQTSTLKIQHGELIAMLPENFVLGEFLLPPLLHKPPAEHLLCFSTQSLSSGLRAPPAAYI